MSDLFAWYGLDVEEIRRIRGEARAHEGPGGKCGIVSEELSERFGLEMEAGAYLGADGAVLADDHVWVVTPDGSIVDATADQFGEGHDVRLVAPADPERSRYRIDSPAPVDPWATPDGVPWFYREFEAIPSAGACTWTGADAQLEDVRDVRALERAAQDGGGMCSLVSEYVEEEYGCGRYGGTYLSPAGDPIAIHYWNLLPDGSILDPTADQFGEGHDIRVIPPGDPEYRRYRIEFYQDCHPGLWHEFRETRGFEWSGTYDSEREASSGDAAWWLADTSERLAFLETDWRDVAKERGLNVDFAP